MNQPRSGLLSMLVIGALLCLAFAGLGSGLGSGYAANNTSYEIRGTVEVVSAKEDPPVIVVKSLHGTKEEIVVAAMIEPGATILRGEKRIRLDHIRAGDSVTLKYVKGRDGLTVRSIVLHRN